MTLISGFLIFRKPENNFDEANQGMFSAEVPVFNHTYYSGVDRMAWFDIDELMYAGQLPPREQELKRTIMNSNSDFSGLDLCNDLKVTLDLLMVSATPNMSEVGALYSEKLSQAKGAFESEAAMEPLGFDAVEYGGCSFIREGVFHKGAKLKEWASKLNNNGLFDHANQCKAYVSEYLKLLPEAEQPQPSWVDYIQVYRVTKG